MLTFSVPPFFCPAAEGLLDFDAAGPANAAATSIAAPTVAMAPESQTFLCIELLSMTQECQLRRHSVVDASSSPLDEPREV
jgi:hypothetical protein